MPTDQAPSRVSDRLRPFGTTIFAEMSALATKHRAVNLSQGFPDFDGPEAVRRAAADAVLAGHNQYAPMPGAMPLREAIAERWSADTGLAADPATDITVTNGCTEAINAAMLGLVNPGDAVVMFEPYYDCYRAAVAMAGGQPRFVALRAPEGGGAFEFDHAELERAMRGARVLLLNTPHNPTGRVFTRAEHDQIAALCVRHGVIAVVDEVYERLTFEGAPAHERLATREGMADRTLTLSSLGKTYSLTGWKVGWAIGCPALSAAVRAAHQFLTFSVALPLQLAGAVALREGEGYVRDLVALLQRNRERLAKTLDGLGFVSHVPDGAYFIMADHRPVSERLGLNDDRSVCAFLTEHVGVAAIPPSVFYDRAELGSHLVRFAFCKRAETIDAAIERLEQGLGA